MDLGDRILLIEGTGEINPFGLYFLEGVTPRVYQQLRGRILEGKGPNIRGRQVDEVNEEMSELYTSLGDSHPHFFQAFQVFLRRNGYFNRQRTEKVAVLTGNLRGSRTIESTVIPLHLGKNLHKFMDFANDGTENETDDAARTRRLAEEWVDRRRYELRPDFESLGVTTSSMYALDIDEDWQHLWTDAGLDVIAALPYFYDIKKGHVEERKVSRISLREYMLGYFNFLSARIKSTTVGKVGRYLLRPQGTLVEQGHQIDDISAFRAVVEDEDAARQLVNDLRSTRIGQFQLETLYHDNYYDLVKKSGFKSFNLTCRLSHGLYGTQIVEIQVMDLNAYWNNYLNPRSSAYHGRYKSRLADNPEDLRRISPFAPTLDAAFGREKPILVPF